MVAHRMPAFARGGRLPRPCESGRRLASETGLRSRAPTPLKLAEAKRLVNDLDGDMCNCRRRLRWWGRDTLRVPGPFALASASLLCHGPYTLSVPSATELFVFAKFLAPPVIEPPDVGPLSAGLELGIALHALLSITKSHPTVFSRRDGS